MRNCRRHTPKFHIAAEEERHGVARRTAHSELRMTHEIGVTKTIERDGEYLLDLVGILREH